MQITYDVDSISQGKRKKRTKLGTRRSEFSPDGEEAERWGYLTSTEES